MCFKRQKPHIIKQLNIWIPCHPHSISLVSLPGHSSFPWDRTSLPGVVTLFFWIFPPSCPQEIWLCCSLCFSGIECLLLNLSFPAPLTLLHPVFSSCVSAQTTQVLQSWQHWLTADLLSHPVWKFTATEAACSLLILFYPLAKRLKPAVKPACREHALGKPPSPPLSSPRVLTASIMTEKFSPTLLTGAFQVSLGKKGKKF